MCRGFHELVFKNNLKEKSQETLKFTESSKKFFQPCTLGSNSKPHQFNFHKSTNSNKSNIIQQANKKNQCAEFIMVLIDL